MHIRRATGRDRDAVRSVHLTAFPEGERETISKLAVDLLSEETTPETISMVAETEGAVVGHVSFSPVFAEGHNSFQGYLLAPLAVKPEYQKRGVGSRLVESGMERLSEMEVDMVFVYGDPEYYGRFGFSADAAEGYTSPYRLQYPRGWQGLALKEGGREDLPVKITCITPLRDPALW